jgi:SAM-dependent methyltransferase
LNWKRLFAKPADAEASAVKLTPELRARIQASFDESSRDGEHFPDTIDPRIYHVKLIREHLGDLRGKRVLDVGCGKGRFARVFHEQEPAAELWGLDISPEMLRFVPAGIHTRAGSMTELPFEGEFFDGAYATESLEHAGADRDHRQECGALGAFGNARVGTLVHTQRAGADAQPALPERGEPVYLLLGRCGTGRAVSGLAGGEVAG